MSTDLRQLLLGTHRGDERSARGLWSAQAPRLLRYARAIVRSQADAEDVVQGAFCRVLRARTSDIQGVADVQAWLAQVTRREAINLLRSRRRESARAAKTVRGGPQRTISAELGAADAELDAALELLPRRLREVLILKHVAGLTFDQIEAATGMNRSTAASRYRAGVEALHAHLSERAESRKIRTAGANRQRHAEVPHA